MIKVFGSTLASLISVINNSQKDNVTWIRNSNQVGGHFAGTDVNEISFDLGMVINEPYSNGVKNPSKPTLPVRQSGLPYVPLIFDFLRNLGFQFKEIEIFALYNNQLWKDYLISDNLEFLSSISDHQKTHVIQEILEKSNLSNEIHPRNKLTSPAYKNLSYKEVMELNSLRLFTESFISPWLSKMCFDIESTVPGIEHRAIWAPIYYPETVLQVLTGDVAPNLLSRKFSVPLNQTLNMVIKQLMEKVKKIPNVTEVLIEKNSYIFEENDYLGEKFFFGSPTELNTYFNSSMQIPIASKFREIRIVNGLFDSFIDVEKVINIVDKEFESYRVTLRSLVHKNHKISIFSMEFGEDLSDSFEFSQHISDFFASLGIFVSFEILEVKKAKLPIFDISHCQLREEMYTVSSSFLLSHGIKGSLVDFRSSSFNDQVLLGLWDYER